MRVAYVCADPGVPVFGRKGASVHVQEVLRSLRRRGAQVHLLCARTGGEPPPDLAGVPVHALPRIRNADPAQRERDLIGANPALLWALDRIGPVDLVYERYSLWSSAGMAYAARSAAAGVLEVNAPLIDEQVRHRALVHRGAAETVALAAMADATAIVTVSEPVADWVRAKVTRTVYVVPNGVNVDRIRPAAPGPRPGFTVGFVGTLKPWHGVDLLVRALARVAGTDRGWRLLLVGDGPQAASLRELAATLGVADLVEMTGAVDPADIPAYLHQMDVAVAPYPECPDMYFSPLKLYEYLAAGLPVIASAIGQVRGVLTDGVDGLLVPAGDIEALAGALAELRADPARRTALGAAARRTAVERHTWDAAVEQILQVAGLSLAAAAGVA